MTQPLVVVSSGSGNTRIIAHAVADAAGTHIMTPAELPEDLSPFNPVSLCFWCAGGDLPPDLKAVMPRFKDKKIACFCTMGSDPGTGHAKAWMRMICEAAVGTDRGNTLEATFLCRGRIDEKRFAHMTELGEGEMIKEREARRTLSETHPDRLDVLNAQELYLKTFGA